MNNENDEKRIQNLFNVLQNDPKSVFYATSNLTKKNITKVKKKLLSERSYICSNLSKT